MLECITAFFYQPVQKLIATQGYRIRGIVYKDMHGR